MKKFHLLDYNHNKKTVKQERLYTIASLIALKYGGGGKGCKNYNHDYIREFWNYDAPYPSLEYFKRHVRVSSTKWYIHNKITVDEPIWNPDFLRGVLAHCKIFWNNNCFPSCEWFNNSVITELLKSCPYGGKMVQTKDGTKNRWIMVPALYLKYSIDSMTFMAGVMAGGQIIVKDKYSYGIFNEKILPYFKQWGIPIEGKTKGGRYLISPLWPSLFVKYMPPELSEKWINLKKPYNANIYAPVLWKTYVNNDFPVDGIPYLKSRRMIYYEFDGEEGAMKCLNKIRVEKNLTVLDNRIKEIVKEWGKNERD